MYLICRRMRDTFTMKKTLINDNKRLEIDINENLNGTSKFKIVSFEPCRN